MLYVVVVVDLSVSHSLCYNRNTVQDILINDIQFTLVVKKKGYRSQDSSKSM